MRGLKINYPEGSMHCSNDLSRAVRLASFASDEEKVSDRLLQAEFWSWNLEEDLVTTIGQLRGA